VAFSFFMPKVPFTKAAEKHSAHMARITGRGALVADLPAAYSALSRIGYYRLTGYMVDFQTGHQPDPHKFKPGTSFEAFRALYELDRKLRWHVLSAIESIEVALRSALCNRLAWRHGSHWHTNSALFTAKSWPELKRKVAETLEFDLALNCRKLDAKLGIHPFLDHYYDTYSSPAMPPCWMLMELASFGMVTRLLSSLDTTADRKDVAQEFVFPNRVPIDEAVLVSWLHGLSVLRNRCAHHSRIVNKIHPFAPKATTNASVVRLFKGGGRLREFLLILSLLSTSVDPKSDWLRRLYFVLDSSSGVNISRATGLSNDWRSDSLWTLAW
jgi:abortive infection bacteriophage resistance protein